MERNPTQSEIHENALAEARRLRREQPPVREPKLEEEEAEPDEDESDGLGPRPGG